MSLYMYNLYEDSAPYADGGNVDFDAVMKAHQEFAASVEAAGAKIVAGEALQPVATATFLRKTRTADVETVDNPLPDLKETLGGFYLIDAPDDSTARKLGELAPSPFGYVEIRPIWSFS